MDQVNMFAALRQYINHYSASEISDPDFEHVLKAFVPKRLLKRQFLLQEGDVCKYSAFIVNGAMRQYSVSNGTENIVFFGIENWWMGDHESFVMLTPSKYNIDAIEECELLLVTYPAMQELKERVPLINKMISQMDQRHAIATQQRIHNAISLSAEERFVNLMETNPQFFQRFPLNMIATYLGMTAESLSRIRKKLASKPQA